MFIGKYEEAISLYKKTIEMDPDYAKAYNNLAIIYFHKRQYELAVEYCLKSRELGFVNDVLLEDLRPYIDPK